MSHHHHAHEDHHHPHAHHAPPADFGPAFALGVGLNLTFVGVEAGAGLWSGSLALLADAGHNLSDVLSLLLAWGATVLARRRPTLRRTYGLRKGTILASLANAALLLLAVGAIASEAVQRLWAPGAVQPGVVAVVAAAGVVINGATALLFSRGQEDLNVRGAFLHMAADAGLSLAVVVGALVMRQTGAAWIDPLLSLVIVAVILAGTWRLLRESMDLALDAVPAHIDPAAVRGWLAEQPGVTDVHDLHIWAMSTTETALTAHVCGPADDAGFLGRVCEELEARFRIGHVTLQVETGAVGCRLAPDEVV